jgi:hypothetical protein
MATTLGSLLIALGLDSAEFKSGLSQAEKDFKRSTKRIEAIGASMSGIGRKMTLAVTAPLLALGVTSIKAAAESKAAIGQVEAALASMGGVAGKTSKQLQELATGQMRQSLYDDDEILRKVTANLLTFGNIAGKAFDEAQMAAINLSARLGQDLQSSALMVGKALNSPKDGLAALRRVGIQFTEQQQEQIKAMVKVGDLAGAQAIMLKELERQFGGAAKAARDANPMAVLQQSFAEFQETVGEKLLPLLPRITDAITKVLDAFGKLSPGMQETVIIVAGLAAAFGPLLIVIGSVTSALAPFAAAIGLTTTTLNAAGIATTKLTVTLATLRAAVLTLVQTLGPYALLLAGIAGIYYALKLRAGEVATATEKYRKAQEAANATSARATALLGQMATANAKLRQEIIARAKADRQAAIQAIAKAKADLIALRAETARLRAFQSANRGLGQADPRFASLMPSAGAGKALAENRENEKALTQAIQENTAAIQTLDQVINASSVPGVADIKVDKPAGSGPTRETERDRTAEIEARFNDELINYTQQALGAKQQLAKSAQERAELEMRSVEWARRQTLAQIAADEDYNEVQKAQLSDAVEHLADLHRQGVELNLALELEQERNDLARIAFEAEREQLALAGDMADTQADRKRIALDILRLEQEYRRNQLEMVVASELASDAEKARAQAILDSLSAIEAGERASVGRANETELESFIRNWTRSPEQMNEAVLGVGLDGLDRLADGLSRALSEVHSLSDAFQAMRDVFQSVIQDMIASLIRLGIQKAIVAAIGSAFGGGGGIPGFSTGMPPMYAKGTNFHPGGLAIVGERGPELVNLRRGAQVIPNSALAGLGSSQPVHFHFPGVTDERSAREAGSQAAHRFRSIINGPVRA